MINRPDLRKWSHPVVRILDIAGELSFPIYASNGVLQSQFCCVLYLPSLGNPVRLDGGSFPTDSEPIRDPDGWVYALVKFSMRSNEDDVLKLLDATAKRMEIMGEVSPSMIKAAAYRVAHKFRRMMAA